MALLLGIDTGGTFTDAAILDDSLPRAGQVIASAKAMTTHDDLVVGVATAISAALDSVCELRPAMIELVSLSTTLATNAIVEGHGDPVALVSCGFTTAELEPMGIGNVVPASAVAVIEGGHDAVGNERTPIDHDQLRAEIDRLSKEVSAFAVVAQFSVRNPAHELVIGEQIRDRSSLPVCYSHRLSSRLDGPRRALTAVLNGRLLGTISRLNGAVKEALDRLQIDAPLMVVRGDGTMVSAEFAAHRPIETVLSGPAASVVGADYLTGGQDRALSRLVVDVGGTTTDVVSIKDGRPAIAAQGASVAGYRTMVEAVDTSTIGLGGDSQVRVDFNDRIGPVLLGPERAIPVSRLAQSYPNIVSVLESQLASSTGFSGHGCFCIAVETSELADSLDPRDAEVLRSLAGNPTAVTSESLTGHRRRSLTRLRQRGLVRISTFTPTDAALVLDADLDASPDSGHPWGDRAAAVVTALLLARQRDRGGNPLAEDAETFSGLVLSALRRRSAEFIMSVALSADEIDVDPYTDPLLAAGLAKHRQAARVELGLSEPLVALGASAGFHYPHVATLLGTTALVPAHASVANAVGAVVGGIRLAQSVTVTQPTKGQFRVHHGDQPSFGSVDRARAEALDRLIDDLTTLIETAGGTEPEFDESWSEKVANVAGKAVFVQGVLRVEASARPLRKLQAPLCRR